MRVVSGLRRRLKSVRLHLLMILDAKFSIFPATPSSSLLTLVGTGILQLDAFPGWFEM